MLEWRLWWIFTLLCVASCVVAPGRVGWAQWRSPRYAPSPPQTSPEGSAASVATLEASRVPAARQGDVVSTVAPAEIVAEPSPPDTKKLTLPPGAEYLPQKEVYRRYGKTPEEAAARDRQIEIAVKMLVPKWSGVEDMLAKGVGENRILKLRGGQELLILSGREWSQCWGFPTALAYDTKRKMVAVLSANCDYTYCEIPETPTEDEFSYSNENLVPKDLVFSILWSIILEGIEVTNIDNLARTCNVDPENIPEDW